MDEAHLRNRRHGCLRKFFASCDRDCVGPTDRDGHVDIFLRARSMKLALPFFMLGAKHPQNEGLSSLGLKSAMLAAVSASDDEICERLRICVSGIIGDGHEA